MDNFFLAIISTKRPQNVKFIQEQLCKGIKCYWYVNEGEAGEYFRSGANFVYEAGTNICHARNLAIKMAWDVKLPCIQISDDLRNVKQVSIENNKRNSIFIDVPFAIERLIGEVKKYNAYFGGVAINNNPLNYTGQDVSTDKLIVNDFICLMPGANYFDEKLALKEDYDYCVTELLDGRKIVRLNNILCDFPHRQNEGGANTYRNDTTEAAATRALMAKWPKYIIPHKTRPGQVSLDYKAIQRRISGTEPTSLFDNI